MANVESGNAQLSLTPKGPKGWTLLEALIEGTRIKEVTINVIESFDTPVSFQVQAGETILNVNEVDFQSKGQYQNPAVIQASGPLYIYFDPQNASNGFAKMYYQVTAP